MNDSRITDDQRKAFADLIKDAQRRFDADFDGYLNSLMNDLTPKIEARARVRGLIDSVRSLKGKLSEAAAGLRKYGFHVDDGMIAIDSDTQADVRQELDEIKRSAVEEREKSIVKFRKAIFDVWSAQDPDEAKKIVQSIV